MQTVLRWTRCTSLPRLAVAATAIAVVVGRPMPASATAEVDCTAIGREALQVDLSTAATDTRYVALHRGETLRFAFKAESGPFGTLTLIEGDGSPHVLLVGPSGTVVSFTAQRGGAFGFRFAKEGEVAAHFSVTCGPPKRSPGGEASARGPALGQGGAALDPLRARGPVDLCRAPRRLCLGAHAVPHAGAAGRGAHHAAGGLRGGSASGDGAAPGGSATTGAAIGSFGRAGAGKPALAGAAGR